MATKHYKRETRYVSVLTVHVPSIHSLIDMMRYDCCHPATERDAGKIEALIGLRAEPDDHIIRLTRVACADVPAQAGRWRSFGCRVLDERSPERAPLTDEEARNLAKVVP